MDTLETIDRHELDQLLDCLFACSAIVPNDVKILTQMTGTIVESIWHSPEELQKLHPSWRTINKNDAAKWSKWYEKVTQRSTQRPLSIYEMVVKHAVPDSTALQEVS